MDPAPGQVVPALDVSCILMADQDLLDPPQIGIAECDLGFTFGRDGKIGGQDQAEQDPQEYIITCHAHKGYPRCAHF